MVRTIRDATPRLGILPPVTHGREPVRAGKIQEPLAVPAEHKAIPNQERLSPAGGDRCTGGVKRLGSLSLDMLQPGSERLCCRVEGAGKAWSEGYPSDPWPIALSNLQSPRPALRDRGWFTTIQVTPLFD